MSPKQLDDIMFEALFRQAVIDAYDEEIDAISSNEELAKIYKFTPEFEMKMKKLFIKERRNQYIRKMFKYWRRTVAAFFITVTILSAILMSNSEVRAAVTKAIVEWYDKFTSITFDGEASEDKDNDKAPSYLPYEFSETSRESIGSMVMVEYSNANGDSISLLYVPSDGSTNISIDNENHTIKKSTINGQEAYIAESTSQLFENGVIWVGNKYRYEVWSKLSIDQLIDIAQSISEQ